MNPDAVDRRAVSANAVLGFQERAIVARKAAERSMASGAVRSPAMMALSAHYTDMYVRLGKEHDRIVRLAMQQYLSAGIANRALMSNDCDWIYAILDRESLHMASEIDASPVQLKSFIHQMRMSSDKCTWYKRSGRASSLSIFAMPQSDPDVSAGANAVVDGYLANADASGGDVAFYAAGSAAYSAAASFSGVDYEAITSTVAETEAAYGTWASYGTGAGSPFEGQQPFSMFQTGNHTFWGAAVADGGGFAAGWRACAIIPVWQVRFGCGAIGFAAGSVAYLASKK